MIKGLDRNPMGRYGRGGGSKMDLWKWTDFKKARERLVRYADQPHALFELEYDRLSARNQAVTEFILWHIVDAGLPQRERDTAILTAFTFLAGLPLEEIPRLELERARTAFSKNSADFRLTERKALGIHAPMFLLNLETDLELLESLGDLGRGARRVTLHSLLVVTRALRATRSH